MPPSDRERRIARRRAEIVEADMRTLLDGGRVNWSRQVLDKGSLRVSGLINLSYTRIDTIRGSHTERTTVNVGAPLLRAGTRVDTIRASGTDSIRTTDHWAIGGAIVQITHVRPDTTQRP